MRELPIGERVVLNGRAFEVTGFTAASVRPQRAFLKDVETGEELVVDAASLNVGSEPNPGSGETS